MHIYTPDITAYTDSKSYQGVHYKNGNHLNKDGLEDWLGSHLASHNLLFKESLFGYHLNKSVPHYDGKIRLIMITSMIGRLQAITPMDNNKFIDTKPFYLKKGREAQGCSDKIKG